MARPDGEVLIVERSAFEERGGGDLLWAGRLPGSETESVILTLTDGRLIGTYGKAGELGFELRAARGGVGAVRSIGTVAPPERDRWCGARIEGPERSGSVDVRERARASPPVSVREEQSSQLIVDVLILYSPAAADYWNARGGVAAELQAAVDYTNSVYRNNDLGATLNVAYQGAAPPSLRLDWSSDVLRDVREDASVAELRAVHRADLVVAFVRNEDEPCGEAWVYLAKHTPRTMSEAAFAQVNLECNSGNYSWGTLAHEVGHIYGGNHDPANTGTTAQKARYSYAFGHYDTAPDPSVYTIMAYRPHAGAVVVPYFSTSLRSPNGWELGHSDADNEYAFWWTLPEVVTFSDYLPRLSPPPSGLAATATAGIDEALVALAWEDNAGDETGYVVELRTGGGNWTSTASLAADSESATLSDLEPETRYEFRVGAVNAGGTTWSDPVAVVTPARLSVALPVPAIEQVIEGMCSERRLGRARSTACEAASPTDAYVFVQWAWRPPDDLSLDDRQVCFVLSRYNPQQSLLDTTPTGWKELSRVCRQPPLRWLRTAAAGLELGKTHRMALTAVLVNESQDVLGTSKRAKFTIGPLGRPKPPRLTGEADHDAETPTVRLEWTSEDAPSGYLVLVKVKGGVWREAASLDGDVSAAVVSDLESDTSYRFRVRGVNRWGWRNSNMLSLRTPE
ncbi:MAG: fibronectin type III domain-containing protein [Acidobacteria bacterium]|nr:fibronectin type III domain-containing protein [Acidobacteriota bacterium]